MSDTNFYRQALAEFQEKNPQMRRASDMTPALLSSVLKRAQELKDEARIKPGTMAEHLFPGKTHLVVEFEDEMERSRR